jgi:uncharacterized protein (TIRG00374 family)
MKGQRWIVVLKTVAVFIISGVLFYYTIQNSGLQWSNLLLNKIQWFWLSTSMIVFLFTVWVQSVRIRVPWKSYFKKSAPDTFNGLMIGHFYNGLLPGNAGEALRAWHFSRKNKISFIRALASQGVEKYVDASNFILYTLILLFLVRDTTLHFRVAGLVCVAVTGVFLLYLLIIFSKKTDRVLLGFLINFFATGKMLYKLHYHIKSFLMVLSSRQIISYLLLGYFMFALNVLQYYIIFLVADVPPELATVSNGFLVAVAMVIVYIIPSAPGNTGVIHYGVYSMLLLLAKEKGMTESPELTQSLAAYTIYLHLSYFIPEVFAGAFTVIKERKWIV